LKGGTVAKTQEEQNGLVVEVCYLDDQGKLCRKSFSNVEAAREFAAGNKKAFLVWDQRVC
jgi:hypothetical protein